jgi:hypothetical protein
MKQKILAILSGIMLTTAGVAARTFVHPGCSYTQGQLDRMKAMVEAKVEPYYTTFQNLKNSEHAQLDRKVVDRGTQIREGQFNGTVGIDGRCAHDLALLWKLTGDTRYADKAVEYLNANNHYTNTSARGTGPLDNGKINLLIEAAELMRDYEGWDAEEQQKFKDMLTYPYYSSTEDVAAKYADWYNDDNNGITFYWNIMNGDAGRHGNQGMFGMLGMLAMGVYLDNEVIYDRALRYVSGLPHRADDLPYVAGPPITSSKPTQTGEFMNTYNLDGRKNEIEDYGYDELLQYYFYPNGQCQESSRDQGHVLAGLHKYIEFAEIAWNQGDRFYSLHDNRLLKGIEFNYRYNLSFFQSYPDQPEPWEPAGYTTDWDEVTLENNLYLQTRTRSGRWESIKPSPDGRGGISNVGSRTSAYAHYLVRAGEPEENTLWLRRTHEYTLDKYGYETSGTGPSWYYEWNGWGTLTKSLETWMAGDPVRFVDGERVSGIHTVPGEIAAADYDYYNISEDGEGHTYHKVNAAATTAYRPDGGVALSLSSDRWVVNSTAAGEWLNYTVGVPVADTYDVFVTYRSKGESQVGAAVAGGEKAVATLAASEEFSEQFIGTIEMPAGAAVVRLYIENPGEELEIASIRVAYNSSEERRVDFEGYLDSRAKEFVADWAFSGMLVSDINLMRCEAGAPETAEVVSADNTFGHYVDGGIEGTVPAYTYWLTYVTDGEECESERVTIEWGELDDRFDSEEVSDWNIPSGNGSGEYRDGVFAVTPNASGASRVSRKWSFPFHAGNFPILAFCMERPEGLTMGLYSGANSWNNGYDTFTGKIGDNVYYYDLTSGSFQNSKGVSKLEFSVEETSSVPLQLRTTGPADASALELKWVRTFRNMEELKAAAEDSGVDEVVAGGDSHGRIYNMTGMDCGTDIDRLPEGIYVIDGKKVLIRR